MSTKPPHSERKLSRKSKLARKNKFVRRQIASDFSKGDETVRDLHCGWSKWVSEYLAERCFSNTDSEENSDESEDSAG